MIRKIIQIDEEKCNGCGLCASACHEGAIEMVDGKAKLVSDTYCDGLGDCLPACPTGAISFVEREAEAYDEQAVKARREQREGASISSRANLQGFQTEHVGGGCPGSAMRSFNRALQDLPASAPAPAASTNSAAVPAASATPAPSQLTNWPVQIKLAPVQAPYFDNAHLLIAADCCAYAYGNFHAEYMRNKICLIGCPKLDGIDYSEKLSQIIASNNIKSVTITRMEVPCCGGLENMTKQALQDSGKFIPWQVVTFSLDGRILE